MSNDMSQATPVIELPGDEKLVAALQKKLGEYEQRVKIARLAEMDVLREMERTMTRPIFLSKIDSLAKRDILKILLEEGKVAWDSLREVSMKYIIDKTADNNDIFWRFFQAFDVIEAYCQNGGKLIKGGTGLPLEEEM